MPVPSPNNSVVLTMHCFYSYEGVLCWRTFRFLWFVLVQPSLHYTLEKNVRKEKFLLLFAIVNTSWSLIVCNKNFPILSMCICCCKSIRVGKKRDVRLPKDSLCHIFFTDTENWKAEWNSDLQFICLQVFSQNNFNHIVWRQLIYRRLSSSMRNRNRLILADRVCSPWTRKVLLQFLSCKLGNKHRSEDCVACFAAHLFIFRLL